MTSFQNQTNLLSFSTMSLLFIILPLKNLLQIICTVFWTLKFPKGASYISRISTVILQHCTKFNYFFLKFSNEFLKSLVCTFAFYATCTLEHNIQAGLIWTSVNLAANKKSDLSARNLENSKTQNLYKENIDKNWSNGGPPQFNEIS